MNKLKSYPTYKDPGAEWIGNIPEHWDTRRFKFYYDLKSERANDTDDVNKIALENIESWTGRYLESNTEFEGSGVLFEPGDILFGKLRPYLAKVLAPDFNGSAVGDIYVFKAKEDVSSKFSFFRILSEAFIHVVNGSTYGAKMPRASWDFISNLVVAIPPLSEQKQIAEYLDKKTGLIDELIEKKRQMIELLKEKRTATINQAVTKGLNPTVPMKDSGIDWLGDIPEHWLRGKFNLCTSIKSGQVDPRDTKYADMVLIAPNHIQSETGILLDKVTAKDQGADSGKYWCDKGDVIYSKIRPALRKACLAPEECLCSADMYPIKGRKNLLNGYLYWFILTDGFSSFAILESDRVAMPKINRDSLGRCYVLLPPLPEQQQIAEHLDRKTAQIDTLITKTKQHIELLQERRTALINDAVTGKIDIRDN